MKVEIVNNAGFCFGVKRAVKMALDAAEGKSGPVYTLGPIIHNPQVVEELSEKGIKTANTVSEISPGKLIIRSHGVSPSVLKEAKKTGHEVVDATCPFVQRAQHYIRKLKVGGYRIFIIGKQNHPEVEGLLGHVKGEGKVIYKKEDIEDLDGLRKVGIVTQTTVPLSKFKELASEISVRSSETRIYNTICNFTLRRQSHTVSLARRADVMIIVGGKNSANTTRLAELCRKVGTETYHIETPEEVKSNWVKGKSLIGISAGASTPERMIKKVAEKLKSIASK